MLITLCAVNKVKVHFPYSLYYILCYTKATIISKAPVTAILSSITTDQAVHILFVITSGVGWKKHIQSSQGWKFIMMVDLCLAKPKDFLDTDSETILFEGSFDLPAM